MPRNPNSLNPPGLFMGKPMKTRVVKGIKPKRQVAKKAPPKKKKKARRTPIEQQVADMGADRPMWGQGWPNEQI